jgi:hypothetical protein
MNENQMKRESVLNRDIANVSSLYLSSTPASKQMITSSFGDGSSLSSPQHYDHHTIIKKKQKGEKNQDFTRLSLFLVFWWGGGCVCVLLTATHISQLPARGGEGERKNSLISCGGLSYGFRVSCPNGGERRPRNR